MLGWLTKIRETRQRIALEDALKFLYQCDQQESMPTAKAMGEGLGISSRKMTKLLQRMQGRGLLEFDGGTLRISSMGIQLALQVIRAHRLWERYLVDEARVPLADVHMIAERREHTLSAEAISELDASMGYPATDPHGDPIPTADGILPKIDSLPLTQWPIGESGMIVHLEDEPVSVFAKIAAEGLCPGQQIKVVESTDRCIVFTDSQRSYVLDPIVAANVFLVTADPAVHDVPAARLVSLELGDTATVVGLDNTLQGYTRRRLLDLGLTSGAKVTAEYRSFLGDPVAYRVRGSLIALRKDQAEHVRIEVGHDHV